MYSSEERGEPFVIGSKKSSKTDSQGRDLPKVKGHDKWPAPEALRSKVQLESHNLHSGFLHHKGEQCFPNFCEGIYTPVHIFSLKNYFKMILPVIIFPLETKWHEIGFYINWMSP